MNIVVTAIKWDTDGKKVKIGNMTYPKNQLPGVVLMLDAPENDDEVEDVVSDALSGLTLLN